MAKTKKKAAKKPTKKAAAKAAPKKAPKKTAAKKAAPKKAAPTKPKKAAPTKVASTKATPKKTAPKPHANESTVVAASSDSSSTDRFRPVADVLVTDLEAARGDEAKETAALQKAIASYLEINGGGDPAEVGLAEYFAEDGSVANPPALERVADASEDDIFRWREKLADLAGY
jgi:hypothetical protein